MASPSREAKAISIGVAQVGAVMSAVGGKADMAVSEVDVRF